MDMEELRQKCQELDREIQVERMTLIQGIIDHKIRGVMRDTSYLDYLLTKRQTIVDIVKWY